MWLNRLIMLCKARIPRHRHLRRHPREDVGVGVVECQLNEHWVPPAVCRLDEMTYNAAETCRFQRKLTSCYVTATVEATARIAAAAHGSFSRTRQMAPVCTPILGQTQVYTPNGIWIGSAVFAGLTVVTSTQTDRGLSACVTSVTNNVVRVAIILCCSSFDTVTRVLTVS